MRKSIPAVIPCSGPKTKSAIELALAHLIHWARREGLTLDRHTPNGLPADALLWEELLRQSLEGMNRDTVPSLPRGELAASIGLTLTERRFLQFQRWFKREILVDLERFVEDKGGLPIRAHRVSDRRGGDPGISEAKYFLTFAPFENEQDQLRVSPDISVPSNSQQVSYPTEYLHHSEEPVETTSSARLNRATEDEPSRDAEIACGHPDYIASHRFITTETDCGFPGQLDLELVLATWSTEKMDALAIANSRFFKARFGFEVSTPVRKRFVAFQRTFNLLDTEIRDLKTAGILRDDRSSLHVDTSYRLPLLGWTQIGLIVTMFVIVLALFDRTGAPYWVKGIGLLLGGVLYAFSLRWVAKSCILPRRLLNECGALDVYTKSKGTGVKEESACARSTSE